MKKRYLFLLSIYILLFVCYLYFSVNETEKLNDKIKDYEYVGDFHEDRAIVKKDGKIGFIDKSGQLIIPMKWEFDKHEGFLDYIYFDNGRCLIIGCKDTYPCLIDKDGNVLYSDVYIRKTDEFDIMSSGSSNYKISDDGIEKIEELENDHAIIAQTSDYNLSEKSKDVFFSLENLCGEKVGINKLKEVYGYRIQGSFNCSFDRQNLLLLFNTKNNKYGIVDQKGNIVVPFDYDNPICYYYGLLIEIICFSRYSDLGMEKYPLYCNVYKDGHLLYEGLPFFKESYASMGMFMFEGCSLKDMYEKYELSSDEIQIPESVEKTKFIDTDGKEVSRFPFGKNYLRYLNDKESFDNWQLEDENGNLLFQQKFSFWSRYKNNIVTEDGFVLNDTGDTIPAGYAGYLYAGIVKYADKFINEFPLCEYNESLSERDNKLNCFHSKKVKREYRENRYVTKYEVLNQDGTAFLPYDVDEVYNFSDGLLRLKLDGHYYFVDEDGKGVKIEK
jgi:hypothetical protein